MKRALLPLFAAVLVLSACGGEDDASPDTSAEAAATESATTGSTTGSTSQATPASAVNEQVREACRAAVVAQAADATFAQPGTLRGSSSPEGKVFTLTGTAQVGGSDTRYTCSVLAADSVEVTEVTVG